MQNGIWKVYVKDILIYNDYPSVGWFFSYFAWDTKMESQYYENLCVIHLFNKHFSSDQDVAGTSLDV